jgi:hypothetical protein
MMGYYKNILWAKCIYSLARHGTIVKEDHRLKGFKNTPEDIDPQVYQILIMVFLSVHIIISMFLFAQSVS